MRGGGSHTPLDRVRFIDGISRTSFSIWSLLGNLLPRISSIGTLRNLLLDPSIGFGGKLVGVYVEMKSS